MLLSRPCAAAVLLWVTAAAAQDTSLLGALDAELVISPASYRVGEATLNENAVRYRGWAPAYLRAAARWYPHALWVGAYADARFETFGVSGPGFFSGAEINERVSGGQLGLGVTLRTAPQGPWTLEWNAGLALHALPFGVYDPDNETTGVRKAGLGFLGPTLGGAVRWTEGAFGAELRGSLLPFSLFGGVDQVSARGAALSLLLQGQLGKFAVPGSELQPVVGYELTVAGGGTETLEASQGAHRFYLGVRGLFGALRTARVPTGPGWIRGRVLTSDGAPLSGAVVRLKDTGEAVTVTADGRYTFREVAPGPRVLEVSAEGFRSLSAEVTVAPEAEQMSELTLERKSGPGRVLGRVLVRNPDGSAGRPLPGAQIRVAEGEPIMSGEEGAFTLEGVGPGLVRLTIEAKGHPPVEEVVSVPPEGEAALEVTLAPEKQRTLASFKGRVRSVRGKALAAEIRIPEARVATRAGKDGRFIVRLPGGTYTVVFSAPGFLTQTKTVQVADGDQALFYVDLSPEER